MAGETRIIAFEAGNSDSNREEAASPASGQAPVAEPAPSHEEAWLQEEDHSPTPAAERIPAAVALVAAAGWSAFFVWARRGEWAMLEDPAAWPAVVMQWAVPVLLICALWLVWMRNSTREAYRFGAAARMLSNESAHLESRLTVVNRELSLAREFLAAQTRDLESLGRVATERLSANASRLEELVRDNGSRIESLGSVSQAALENLEQLRSQLPVIASSAKDVTNNIGAAGRTAHAQLAEMVSGFNRLNEFGQASERQVSSLRTLIDSAIGEFTRQSEKLDEIATHRFAALAERGAAFRSELDQHEAEALAAVRLRATTLTDELQRSRTELDRHEAESLTSLRARVAALRDEGATIARSLRDGEARATDGWRQAATALETHIADAVSRIEREQERLASGLREAIAELDREIAARRAAHMEQSDALAARAQAVAAQLSAFTRDIGEVAAHGEAAEHRIAQSLRLLNDNLATSRTVLDGAGGEIVRLTDDSVRLLEILQATRQQTSEDLPHWIAAGEERLALVEQRITAMHRSVDEATDAGDRLSHTVEGSSAALVTLHGELELLQAALTQRHDGHRAAIASLKNELDAVSQRSHALAASAQGELAEAIRLLQGSVDEAIAAIGQKGAGAVADLAAKFREDSASAIAEAMRTHAAQASGQLEVAATTAAGVSREAAIQLRDQLARVNELVGNLERRVAHARQRAEEQVDNDFARRAALITEALNSNAIDIAKALSTDVADTAWAAYLRGDRGIFTRRAVNLIETGETRHIAQLYETDRDFREHVSRYVHDFEAILRQVLSTRDGHALGVTLLSSDMGKLYVALAQAIERLRD